MIQSAKNRFSSLREGGGGDQLDIAYSDRTNVHQYLAPLSGQGGSFKSRKESIFEW